MIIEDKITVGINYLLKFPVFCSEDGEYSAGWMNHFYETLASEIVAYTESDATIRRYKADHLIEQTSDTITVNVTLNLRRKSRGCPAENLSRSLKQVWRKGILISYSST